MSVSGRGSNARSSEATPEPQSIRTCRSSDSTRYPLAAWPGFGPREHFGYIPIAWYPESTYSVVPVTIAPIGLHR
jgi:hypothetical protein